MGFMAHVRKTKHGYEIKVHIGDGKYQSRSVRAPHNKEGKHDAELQAAQWQKQVDESRGRLDMVPTVAQCANRWLLVMEPSWSEAHARTTRTQLNTHILPQWGDALIRDITLLEVQTWFAGLTRTDGEPMKASSLARYKATLSGLFSFAVEHGYAQRNLCRSVRLPKIDNERPLPDTAAIRRTINLTEDVRWSTFAHLAAVTGARREELCALRWSDIVDDTMQIRRSVSVRGTVQSPKTRRSRRDVTLVAGTLERLAKLRAERPYHTDGSYVFSAEFDGSTPLMPDSASKWWQANRRDNSITLHDLRHHAASQMLGNGIDIGTVAGRLGQDPATTLRVYAHVLPRNDGKAAKLLASLM